MAWIPNPGPQTDAYLSEADMVLYGGQAGGGKSNLLLGWGVNEASIGIIFRREMTQTDGLEADGKKIIGSQGWNGSDHEWTRPDGRTLKLAGMREPESWMDHAGRERDYQGYDEAGEFLEEQVGSMVAWLRSEPGKRTRIILGSNPPRTTDGYWMFIWFGPWIDPEHHLYPTAPGAIRWAIYIAKNLKNEPGVLVWTDGPGEYQHRRRDVHARCRTDVHPSELSKTIRIVTQPSTAPSSSRLPEPLRSQLLKGDWQAGLKDRREPGDTERLGARRSGTVETRNHRKAYRCARSAIDPVAVEAMTTSCMSPRYDSYFATLIKVPAKDVPQDRLGSHAAGLVIKERRDGAIPIIDMGGGYGGALLNHLTEQNHIECLTYKGSEGTTRRTADKKFGFPNVRSAAYWKMREDLDPDQPGGSKVALPPDKRLLAGLCAPRFEVKGQEVKVEPKSKNQGGAKGVIERLGWSPNEADAVVMANWAGPRWATHATDWINHQNTNQGRGMRGMQPKVVLGHQNRR
jgi:hypothetical protein